MVRHCAVRGCNNTDMSTLCHRFPKRKDAFEQWQRSLQLVDAEASLLMQRFVVCTLHFKTSDYRNGTSRMLNTVAIPTLSINNKDAFYDAPTSTSGTGSGRTGNAGGRSTVRTCSCSSVKKALVECIPKAESPRSDDQEDILISSSLIIERVEPPEAVVEEESEEDMIYFIEEEVPPSECIVPDPDVEDRLRESNPTESPEAKRFRSECDTELDEQPETLEELQTDLHHPAVVEYRNSSVQTDDVEIVSHEDQMHRRMLDECYPEYAGLSRLEFAKQLKEKDERLAELTKKLANFETAHAAMMKTMEAFKTLVN